MDDPLRPQHGISSCIGTTSRKKAKEKNETVFCDRHIAIFVRVSYRTCSGASCGWIWRWADFITPRFANDQNLAKRFATVQQGTG
jgi:hypothetical protein